MRTFAPLLVVTLVGLPLSARAQHTVHPATGHTSGGGNAVNHQMVQQQRAMEAEFKQQQKMMEAQLKQEQQMMLQQQKMMQQQALQQQKAMTAHEKGLIQQQQQKMTATATTTRGQVHHDATNAKTKEAHELHHVNGGHVHWLRVWPVTTSPSYRRLEHLKHQLDGIASKSNPSTAQKVALKSALLGVVENSPRPASGHVQTFANHLAAAMANRTNPVIDTRDLTLQLRVMMNNVHMTPVELDATMVQHQQLMLAAGVNPQHVGALSDDLRYLVGETTTKAVQGLR